MIPGDHVFTKYAITYVVVFETLMRRKLKQNRLGAHGGEGKTAEPVKGKQDLPPKQSCFN
jgi:hypothetical protein